MSNTITLPRDTAYSDHLAEKFLRFKDDHRFTDCKILVDGATTEAIECHANILCAFSPVIERMLENPMIEGRTKELKFPEIDPNVVKLIVDYMYTGAITMKESDVKEIVRACDFLEMLEPRDRYVKEVLKVVSPSNVIGWMKLSSALSLDTVTQRCLEVISNSFQEVTLAEEFRQLSLEELEYFLQDCCGSENISMDDRLNAVFSWLSYKQENRICERALDIVDSYLHACSNSMLTRISAKYHKFLSENPTLHQKIATTLKRKDKSTLQAAISAMLSLVVIGGSYSKIGWNLEQDELKQFTEIPENFFGSCNSVCRYEGVGLIVTGGLQKCVCAVYNALSKAWKSSQVLTFPRHSHASVCIMEELFVIGGKVVDSWDQMVWTSSAESLTMDVETAKWQKVPPTPIELQFPKAVDLDDRVYLMGDDCQRLYDFDVLSRTWTEKSALSYSPGSGFSLASGNGKVFAVGDRAASVYCVATDCWTQICTPGMTHRCGAAVYYGSRLLLLGGETADVEEYQAEEVQWEMASVKLPKALRNHFAFSMVEKCSV